MRKLIYIANSRIPTERAHGIQIMKMCQAFAGSLEVELILPRRFNPIKQNPFAYYQVGESFKIKKLPCLPLQGGGLLFALQKASFFLVLFFYLLFKRADIVYTREKFFLPLRLIKKNLFFEAHTFPKNYSLYSFWFKRIKGIITITSQLKQLFQEQGIVGNKILLAADGVDIEKFQITNDKLQIRQKFELTSDKRIALYTGHLYEWKGTKILLEAAQYLPSVLFVFVGGTVKDVASFREKAKGLANVLIIGHRPYSEIPLWLKAADVLVLPNSAKSDISKFWTSPLKMFEYMAAQKPIVASSLPSIREVLNAGNAILVEPDNPQALSQGIEQSLKNQDLSAKIAAQACQDVEQYSWQTRADNVLSFVSKFII